MTNDPGTAPLLNRIDNDFVYHAPKPGQSDVYAHIRENARQFAILLVEHSPQGRELSLALTKLEEAVFWANAGIARHG